MQTKLVDSKVFIEYYIDTYGLGKLTIKDMSKAIESKLGVYIDPKEIEYILSLPDMDEPITEEVLNEMMEQCLIT